MSLSPKRIFAETGRVIYAEGEPAGCAYLLLRGRIDLTATVAGEVLSVGARGVGDLFGELALVDDSTRRATAVALEDCDLLAITSDQISSRVQTVDPLLRICLSAILARYSALFERLRPQDAAPRLLPVWAVHAAEARSLLSFEHELRSGIARDELDLVFQPIVRLATGRLAGFETLIRWQHPARGLLLPGDFIPFAETRGLISDITTLCLRKVGTHFPKLQKAAAANAANVDRLFVSVNVSGLDLAHDAFAATTVSILGDAGIEPEDVKLEVTESVLMKDAERCARTLANCRDQGFAIAIDDFGTGYSSLHYLNALPINVLKMDQSFCRSLLGEEGGRKIIGGILHLGRELGLSVVAEGVEQTDQRAVLDAMGCDMGQGFLFGAAVDCAETARRIRAWRADAVPAAARRAVPPAA